MSSSKVPKQQLLEQLAQFAQAFASGARLEILDFLAQGDRSVDALARVAGLSIANTSKHLQQLKALGLVEARRAGKQVFYQLADDRVLDVIAGLRALAESQSDAVGALVRSYLFARDELEPVGPAELLALASDGLVTVLDVRPAEEYVQGHIPGALNVPLDNLKSRLRSLPANQEVIAYCRGPWCVLSFEAVRMLRKAGFTARRLQDGLPEWRRAGHPMAMASGVG